MALTIKYDHVLEAIKLIEKEVKAKSATDADGAIDLKDLLDLIKDGSKNVLGDADLEGKYDLLRDIAVAILATDGDIKALTNSLTVIFKEELKEYMSKNSIGVLNTVKNAFVKAFSFLTGFFKKS